MLESVWDTAKDCGVETVVQQRFVSYKLLFSNALWARNCCVTTFCELESVVQQRYVS
jgi:hypothetical protein